MSFITLSRILAYSGTLPFIYSALTAWSIAPFTDQLAVNVADWGMAYTAIILSFLSGMQWVYAMDMAKNSADQKRAIQLLVNANMIAIWAWFMWGLMPSAIAYLGMAFAFVWMLWLDYIGLTPVRTQNWFWNLRWQVTLIATCSLIFSFCASH